MKPIYLYQERRRKNSWNRLSFITGVGVLKVVGTELLVILIVVEWWWLSFDEFFKSLKVFFGSSRRGKGKKWLYDWGNNLVRNLRKWKINKQQNFNHESVLYFKGIFHTYLMIIYWIWRLLHIITFWSQGSNDMIWRISFSAAKGSQSNKNIGFFARWIWCPPIFWGCRRGCFTMRSMV